MASLTVEAQTARAEARRMRDHSQVLRVVVRGNIARSHEDLAKAHVEADRARARRFEPHPSPWSTLRWTDANETFDRTLVPID